MKILYAIQGTGNGHISRARDILPLLEKKGELDVLISGIQADVQLDCEVKYRLHGLSFIFGKHGGVDVFQTLKQSKPFTLWKEIKNLPVENYDVVISDYEPISSWACKLKNIPCIGLSHQSAVINPKSPKPKSMDFIGKFILKNYAPATHSFGFHFESYDNNIFTPVIREQIRRAIPTKKEYYVVYLPAYSDEKLINILSEIENIQWKIFSKHTQKGYKTKNIEVFKIDNTKFIQSLVACTGVLCGAGFETPAEALFLKKKVMVIPMAFQYEQQCNAASIEKLGLSVIPKLSKKYLEKIKNWTQNENVIAVDWKNQTEEIIDKVLNFNTELEIIRKKII